MKTFFRNIIIALSVPALLLVQGCSDFLDKEPVTDYDSGIILTTTDGMEALLTGMYDLLAGRYYYGSHMYLYEAAKGPDFFTRNVSGGSSYNYETRYTESSILNGNAKNSWLQIYSLIRNATLLIENIDDVPATDTDIHRRIKGEAYALRGLAYFDLMRLFAYPPIFSCTWGGKYNEQFKWGVPIIKDVETGTNIFDYEIRRETADDTYAYILDQFGKAALLLGEKATGRGRMNPAAVKALTMRALLYMEKWDEVITLGEEWIAQYEGQYSMLSWESYPENYHMPFNSESVWELGYSESDNLGSNALNYWVRKPTYELPGNELDGKVSQNVGYAKLALSWGHTNNGLNFLTNYTNDVRQYLICELGIENHPDYKGVRRYVGTKFHYVHNIPMVRLPEIYLSLAEAYFNVGDTGMAADYTTRVSLPRRKAAASITSAANVLNERRREFILEGHTYWDYFRTARNLTNRQIIENSTTATISFGSPSGRSYRVVYPIPLAEMNANPAIRDQQNPGYDPWVFGTEENS